MTHLVLHQRKAGFFSDFNLMVACLQCFHHQGIEDFNFYWTNFRYQSRPGNMFEKYFFKNKFLYPEIATNSLIDFFLTRKSAIRRKTRLRAGLFDVCHQARVLGKGYFKAHNDHMIYEKAHQVLFHYNYFNNPFFLQCQANRERRDNSLGVHIRGTDHHHHGPLLGLDFYLKEIDARLQQSGCTSIFVATDEEAILNKMRQAYGDSMVFFNRGILRSETDVAIHHCDFSNKEKLVEDVMMDALSLSACDEILVTSSNVSAYAISVNPAVRYHFIDKHVTYR